MKPWRSGVTLLLLPEEGGKSRSVHLTAKRLRIFIGVAVILCVSFLVMASSWTYLAIQTGKGWALRATVDSLEAERIQFQALAEQLDRAEVEYERLRLLFGPSHRSSRWSATTPRSP